MPKAVLAQPKPECIKDNRGILRTLNYVCRLTGGNTKVTTSLVELTRKDCVRKTDFKKNDGPTQGEAFACSRRAITSVPVLKYPDHSRQFIVHTDASAAGVGAFLAQRSRESSSDSDLDINACYSHRLRKASVIIVRP